MPEHHELMGGKLHVYRRENSSHWQCSTYLAGKNWRISTKEESLAHAKDFAEDWYLELKGKRRAGELKIGKTFKDAAEKFLHEYEVITAGERSPAYVKQFELKLRVHLLPFFGDKVLSEITPGLVQEYRIHRATPRKDPKTGEPLRDKRTGEPLRPARSTLHQEIVTLRHVLKTANRHGWLPYLPDLSAPYKSSSKISHRAWFSPQEYKRLYEATRARAKNPKKPRWRKACEDLHDYVLFMANTGLRPDEAARLEFRDVAIVTDEATGERILEIEVRGKRGVGYCKGMTGAVMPFQRLRKRKNPQQTDRIFGKTQRELLNAILKELNLKFDRDGNRRTAYSLRHTYICLRLMEGADIYQVAKNCRTSVEMIEKFYASHIKNTLDAAAINVRKPKPKRNKDKPTPNDED
ncbi:MAG TPA: site-specific integrase [Verrucomicrobiae bacterium]|nr:site-specific integrase [Verrucomicrobiae bacterium]